VAAIGLKFGRSARTLTGALGRRSAAPVEAPVDPASRSKPILLATFLLVSSLIFAALALWQVERRAEKLALIAAVDRRLHSPPVAAPGPADWPGIGKGDAYRPVRARGIFLHDRETLVQAVSARGPGYWVVTPLRTDAGWTLLVNRGFVAPEDRDRAVRRRGEPEGAVTVAGLFRITEPGGAFLHSNDPAHDRWYSRDVAAIGRARGLGAVAPYFIDEGAAPGGARQPVGGLTIVSFPNNHLQYALTWFVLAALAMAGVVRVWRGKR
jgi:surfeit locus 1 family protein